MVAEKVIVDERERVSETGTSRRVQSGHEQTKLGHVRRQGAERGVQGAAAKRAKLRNGRGR